MDGTRLAGLVLIGVGATLLVIMTTDLGGEVALLALGVGFLLGYAVRGLYGLLVAGAILTGLGGGAVAIGQGAPDGAGALGLGVGFLLIAVVDRVRTPGRAGWWWAFIPGGILVVTALPSLTGVPEVGAYLLPAALVLVGVLLLLRPRRTDVPTETASSTDPPPPPPGA